MANSILEDVKKVLGLVPTDDSFDVDVMMHTNAMFAVLHQLGIGPPNGFVIEDDTATWDAFTTEILEQSTAKTYITLRVRAIFDPPSTSFHLDAMEKQFRELEVRLNVMREGREWIDPVPSL